MDIVMRSSPLGDRGVAGSLSMLTRTIGMVTGAALLTLIFHTVEAGAGDATAGFLTAFRTTFLAAGAVSAAVGMAIAMAVRIRSSGGRGGGACAAPAGPLYGVSAEAALGPGSLLSTPSYLRLWTAGAIGNGMRWLELLVAGIFTWQLTQSTFLVARWSRSRGPCRCCSSARSPGSSPTALDRKRLSAARSCSAMAANSAVLALLAGSGGRGLAHRAGRRRCRHRLGSLELAVRRRMIGECVAAGPCGGRRSRSTP